MAAKTRPTMHDRWRAVRDAWTPEALILVRQLAGRNGQPMWYRAMAAEVGVAERSLQRWENGEVAITRMAGTCLGAFAEDSLSLADQDAVLAQLENKSDKALTPVANVG